MVQQLAVHTIGGVVTPAQALLVIVPSDSRLEIEAMVSNRDIGFVHAGQEAEIKVDTFNFTRYGLLHGKVLSVSQDAIVRDKPQRSARRARAAGRRTRRSEPKGQELNYCARVSLDRTQMQIDDKMVNLSPGMAVTVEIKTGSRTHPELSPVAAAALSAREPARAIGRRPAFKSALGEGEKDRYVFVKRYSRNSAANKSYFPIEDHDNHSQSTRPAAGLTIELGE